jgi:uridine kinase
VEGLWLLWPPGVRALFDLRVFLDCPESLRWQRRLARDQQDRGRTTDSIQKQFWNVVAPMNKRFVEVQKPWADLVIEQPISQTNLDRLIATTRALRIEAGPTAWEISRARTIIPAVATLNSL